MIRKPVYNRYYHHNYDRKPGATLKEHPDNPGEKVLNIRRLRDSTVYSERDGAIWNFPAGKAGIFETRIKLLKGFKGGLIALNDRWFQPTDSYGEKSAIYTLTIPANGVLMPGIILQKEKWLTIKLQWNNTEDTELNFCELYIDNYKSDYKLPLNKKSFFGISYVRFRSTSVNPDNDGFLVEYGKSEILQ